MRRGYRCREDIFKELRESIELALKRYGSYLQLLKEFERVAEGELREKLVKYYSSSRSLNQAWRSCKGSLFEYVVYKIFKT